MAQDGDTPVKSGITVRLFASLREDLGVPSFEFDLSSIDGEPTVLQVRNKLIENNGANWLALASADIRIAVNHTLAQESMSLQSGDELAFFPPVTGG